MTMTAPPPRPRVVDTAFWTWLAASVLLVLGGLLIATSTGNIPGLFRGMGGLFAVAGFAMGYLAGRTRQGDKRFRRATVALTLALMILVTLFALSTMGFLWLVIIVLLITAATLAMRPVATEWFDAAEPSGGGHD
jgi:biotin transporter BioY